MDGDSFLVTPDPSRYVTEEKVAEGGMGVVWRVLDRSLGRTVAMKVCTEPSRTRFIEEARVTAGLDHPGIVPVHELGISPGGSPYFTMPLVRGMGLAEVFDRARRGAEGWNLARAASVLVRACQAVAYAHAKGVIHRDLKPANIMVGPFGEVYVLDWGVAGSRGHPSGADEGAVLGTPAYMPPEQAEGRIGEVDERSDVYSLGAILYELLAGQPPYLPPGTAVAPEAILARVREDPPRPVRDVAPSAPRELAAVCARAMARDPARRYPGAFDLAEDLQAWLDHRVVAAYRTGAVAALRAWCRRHRTPLWIAAAVAAVSAAVLVTFQRAARIREAERAVASARIDIDRFREIEKAVPEMRRAWLDARMAQRSWAPAWQRADEIRAHRDLAQALDELDARFNGAVRRLSAVLRLAPASDPSRAARRHLEDLYSSRYRAIESGESIRLSSAYYRDQLEDLDPERYRAALDASGRVELRSEPEGARVWCFRYVEGEDTRLEPRPFDPSTAGVVGSPLLRIDAILDPGRHQGVFAAGDRILQVAGRAVRTRADLAAALEGLAADRPVEARIERLGTEMAVEWVPFPSGSGSRLKPGSLVSIHEQLGLDFEGYPLDFDARCGLGTTSGGAPVVVDLPRGSYLVVLRKAGYLDARVPLLMPWHRPVESVRLVEAREAPEGFVHVPAGRFSYGGDLHAFQSLERGEADLPGYFIARHEVTVREYIEFLDDPEVSGRIDGDGTAEPAAPAVRSELEARGEDRLLLVPAKAGGELYLERHDGRWRIRTAGGIAELLKPASPVTGISQLAAVEYAAWRTRVDGRLTYRLPDDLEWEKAARGVDRRTHVWGEYLVASLCWSAEGLWSPHLPPAVGIVATDESVYGVRDLAGSVEEHTSSRISRLYATRRGGNWSWSDPQNLRAANRNSRLVTGRGTETGFRLVAELPR